MVPRRFFRCYAAAGVLLRFALNQTARPCVQGADEYPSLAEAGRSHRI